MHDDALCWKTDKALAKVSREGREVSKRHLEKKSMFVDMVKLITALCFALSSSYYKREKRAPEPRLLYETRLVYG